MSKTVSDLFLVNKLYMCQYVIVMFSCYLACGCSSNKCGNVLVGSKSRLRNGGLDEDDGDYATLRELPLAGGALATHDTGPAPLARLRDSTDDNTSEEGKVNDHFTITK